MLKQKLEQKLLQKLSPQQIQLIKLLEVPTFMLEQRIKKEMEENPILEEGSDIDASDSEEDTFEEEDENKDDEFTIDDYLNEEDTPSYKLKERNYSKDDKKEDIPFSVGTTFREHLYSQIGLRALSEKQQELAKYIVGNIDDDGYLRREIYAIVDDLALTQNVITTEQELEEVLTVVQEFEPIGIGAHNLQECLLIQLNAKKHENKDIKIAREILDDYFNEFTKKHYNKIIKGLSIEKEDLKAAIEEIVKLNPRPGGSFENSKNKFNQVIMPDFILEYFEGELLLQLNQRNAPELRVSRTYANMLKSYSEKTKPTKQDKDAITYVKQKLDSANWFIDAIKQRNITLLSTMNEIIEYQKEYFIDGDEAKLRPMILKDIAELTELDISTISRVANSKYIQTHFGIFPLKHFFSEGMMTDSGEEVSTREIKKILQQCVNEELKNKPLTDEKLALILNEKGYPLARRTVAKYREQLNIPVARLRKEL